MSEFKLLLVWYLEICGLESQCHKGLSCSFSENIRKYFEDYEKAYKFFDETELNAPDKNERESFTHFRTFELDDIIEKPDKLPDKIYCLWCVENTNIFNIGLDIYESEDSANEDLKYREENDPENTFLYGIDSFLLNKEN